MLTQRDGLLLRIYLGESDRHHGEPLYAWIVRTARERGMAGATVLRGIQGFGAKSHMHTASILRLSTDLPILVEIVDVREKIEDLLRVVDPVLTDGMITMEKVDVRVYRGGSSNVEHGTGNDQGR
jgi:PII-like signaling protein